MPKTDTTKLDIGKVAYDAHWKFTHVEHPRLGMRTATWDELPEHLQTEWREVARAVIGAFVENIKIVNSEIY